MSPGTVSLVCGLALASMSGAALSHWWTVRHFVATIEAAEPAPPWMPPAAIPTAPATPPAAPEVPQAEAPPVLAAVPAPAPDPAQKEFFEALLEEMRGLRGENRDLRDQMAETNRDVMKLEFRVDTHSESFRPLPVADTRFDTTFDTTFDPQLHNQPGVLPPLDLPPFRTNE